MKNNELMEEQAVMRKMFSLKVFTEREQSIDVLEKRFNRKRQVEQRGDAKLEAIVHKT
jgi:hypothetical protein